MYIAKRHRHYWGWSGILLLLLLPQFSASAQSPVAPSLFSDTPGVTAALFDAEGGREIVRQRTVVVDFSVFEKVSLITQSGTGSAGNATRRNKVSPAVASSNQLRLKLFDDVNVLIVFERAEGNQSGSRTWFGKVDGVNDSSVILVVKKGVVVGNISFLGKIYQVRFAGNGQHRVNEIDQSLFPPEAAPGRVNNPADQQRDFDTAQLDYQSKTSVKGDSNEADGHEANSVIDVLVVYTSAAKAEMGGAKSAVENLIDLAIAESNIGYANSGINQRLNLVHSEQLSYTESGSIQTDRDRLRIKGDGYMDNVHALRDIHSADVVTMVGYSSSSYGYCGIAYIMETVAYSFEEYAFNVTAHNCATGYYSFAHELGHIMSARHDWYVDDTSNSPFIYNHGYVNTASNRRSVMAYSSGCNTPGSCNRLNYWSNPDDGPISPWGTGEDLTEAADNRKTLNNTGFTVANFRLKKNDVGPSLEFPSGSIADGGASGVMFNLMAKKTTTIHGFSTAFFQGGIVSRIEIYYREGPYDGLESTPSAWKLAGSVNNISVNESPAETHIPINLDITIPAGQTYAFHIYDSSYKIDFKAGSSEGALYASNDQLELYEGHGCEDIFDCPYFPQVFAGTIYHSYAKKPASLDSVFPDNGQDGIMFDIHAKDDIVIHGFSSYLEPFSNNWAAQVEVYYRLGTHVGHENSAAGWTKIGPVNNVVAANVFGQLPYVQNRIPLEMSIPVSPGETYAFYITAAPETPDAALLYQSAVTATGSIFSSNGQMEVMVGKGKIYPFTGNFDDRAFTGTVHYSYDDGFCFPIILNNGNSALLCL